MLENTEGVIKKDNPEKLATQCTQDTEQINVREYPRGNKKKTIQRNWQHRIHKTQDKYMLENTEGVIEKDSPEKLATQDAKDTGQIHVREYLKGNKKKDNPEKLATYGTQDTGQINVREY